MARYIEPTDWDACSREGQRLDWVVIDEAPRVVTDRDLLLLRDRMWTGLRLREPLAELRDRLNREERTP